MAPVEIFRQKSFSEINNINGPEPEKEQNYYIIPKGVMAWPEKRGVIIDRYRGELTADVVATPVLIEKNNGKKQQKEKEGLIFWVLLGKYIEQPDGSIVIKNGATLHFNQYFWQIPTKSIIGTGKIRENKIKRIKPDDHRR